MSGGYTKLFQSIVSSTIWQAPDHVRIVWVTMLALKDQDGIVEASVPGLARIAGKTIEETENALEAFLSPDPYSRTKDHEGRRIAVVDGGWQLLNHEKYRDKLNPTEQRKKKAERQARYRAKVAQRGVDAEASTERLPASTETSHETPVDAARPYTDTDPDRVRVLSSSGSSPSEPPPERPRDLVQASGVPDGQAVRAAIVEWAAGPVPAPMSAEAKMLWPIRQRLAALRETLAAELGLPTTRYPHPTPEDERDALARLRESADPVGDLDAVFAEVERDARASSPPSLEFVSWSMFRPRAWSRKLSKHGAAAAVARAAPLAAGRVEPKPADQMDRRKPWEIPAAEVEAERARSAAERGGRR